MTSSLTHFRGVSSCLVGLCLLIPSLFAMGACSPDDGGDGNEVGGNTETQCGELTCTPDEFCLTHDPSPFGLPGETTLSCVRIPDGCEGLSFCDCEATEGQWEGEPITSCTNLGERHLTVTDPSCGTEVCAPNEGCIAFGTEYSNHDQAGENYCHPLPDGCTASREFCDTDCPARLAESAGEIPAGCMGTSWVGASLVTSSD